jgi:4'-phosphopantetheinyl transferase
MPVLFSKEEAHYQLVIWQIEEPESFFASALGFNSDKKHPKRRLEHLSGRYLLKVLHSDFPFEKMVIGTGGKPELSDESLHFSISHSFPYAAAIISKDKSVGIDIQVFVDKIQRLSPKFLTPLEQKIVGNTIPPITLAWAAKEALFKYYGLGAVDFKEDMPIQHIRWYEQHAKVHMQLQKTREQCVLTGFVAAHFAVAWI